MRDPLRSVPLLRKKLHLVEAELRELAPQLERLAMVIGSGPGLKRIHPTELEVKAISAAIIYAHANVVLASVGASTGSIPPNRN